jgi:hypothetical protein
MAAPVNLSRWFGPFTSFSIVIADWGRSLKGDSQVYNPVNQ